jgi:hypothetical protein
MQFNIRGERLDAKAIWFAGGSANKIGRITPAEAPTAVIGCILAHGRASQKEKFLNTLVTTGQEGSKRKASFCFGHKNLNVRLGSEWKELQECGRSV